MKINVPVFICLFSRKKKYWEKKIKISTLIISGSIESWGDHDKVVSDSDRRLKNN